MYVSYSAEQAAQMVADMVSAARRNGGKFDVLSADSGAIVATITAHELPTRPKDMPRALRPKQKLSKRQRDQAKRSKLRTPVAA